MIMFTNRTIMVALFTIAIASSLIAVSGFVGSAYAATKKEKVKENNENEYGTVPTVSLGKDNKDNKGNDNTDKLPAVLRSEDSSDDQKSKSTNADGPSAVTGDTTSISAKDLKSLSKCQSGAAADGDLTLAEVKDCYSQVF
jgi:cytoskeletal protein RodZ